MILLFLAWTESFYYQFMIIWLLFKQNDSNNKYNLRNFS